VGDDELIDVSVGWESPEFDDVDQEVAFVVDLLGVCDHERAVGRSRTA
jgi:hypothetical protein